MTRIIITGGRSTVSHETEGFDPAFGGLSASVSKVSASGLRRGERWKKG
jgi:hypothetical protein